MQKKVNCTKLDIYVNRRGIVLLTKDQFVNWTRNCVICAVRPKYRTRFILFLHQMV